MSRARGSPKREAADARRARRNRYRRVLGCTPSVAAASPTSLSASTSQHGSRKVCAAHRVVADERRVTAGSQVGVRGEHVHVS